VVEHKSLFGHFTEEQIIMRKENIYMLSPIQAQQERLYHQKNALYLHVAQLPLERRRTAAYTSFMQMHTDLQERVRSGRDLLPEDLAALAALAKTV
jgi:hypothetical protein